MSDFDDRWRRLASAARDAGEPPEELSPRRIADLASLARRRPVARLDASTERRSAVAIAALFGCVFFALLPCRAQVAGFLRSAATDLAELPTRVPRPPHPPSAAAALEALIDLTPFSVESAP